MSELRPLDPSPGRGRVISAGIVRIRQMSSVGYAAGLPASRTQTLFGRVMALVALTVGFATLGAYLGRNLGGAEWFVAWLIALSCLVGLNVASARGSHNLALALLLAFGLLMGA